MISASFYMRAYVVNLLSKQLKGLDMPKHRQLFSFEAALMELLEAVGHEVAAGELGRSASLLRKWADPDRTQRPSLEQGLALDSLYIEVQKVPAERAPLAAQWLRCLRVKSTGQSDAKALPDEMLGVAAGVGALATTVREAIADGRLDAGEREALRLAIRDLRRNLDDVAAAIDHAP